MNKIKTGLWKDHNILIENSENILYRIELNKHQQSIVATGGCY